MLIRLAYDRDVFKGNDLTPIQYLAHIYAVKLQRRDDRDYEENKLKNWTAVLNPIRFREVFMSETLEQDDAEDFGMTRETEGLLVTEEDFGPFAEFLQKIDGVQNSKDLKV